MAVLKMQKISICALKKDRKAILEQLQHLGVLEVDREKEEDAFFQKMDTTGQRMKFEKAATAADQALGILDAYAPEKKSLLSSLEGKELIDRELEEKVQISGPELIKTAREIYDLDREYAELRAGIAKIENQIESLMPWMALDVPLQEGKTKRTALILGTMPGELTLENIYSILLEKTPEVMDDLHCSHLFERTTPDSGRSTSECRICKTVPELGQDTKRAEGSTGNRDSSVKRADDAVRGRT